MLGLDVDRGTVGQLDGIEKITGYRPRSCPWRAFDHPLVGVIVAAYRACSNSDGATPALLLPSDPPAIVWNGVLHYAQGIEQFRSNARKIRDEERRRANAKRK